jgi:hypothetical protein
MYTERKQETKENLFPLSYYIAASILTSVHSLTFTSSVPLSHVAALCIVTWSTHLMNEHSMSEHDSEELRKTLLLQNNASSIISPIPLLVSFHD